MKVAIIGRNNWTYDSAVALHNLGYEIPIIFTAKESLEYTRKRSDFKALAERIGAEYVSSGNINKEEYIDLFKRYDCDVAVSINYSGVIPESVIECFRLGILNAHAGDLPRYRGNAVMAWALINGENRIGLCIHKMIGGELDSGPIISKSFLDIDHNTRISEVIHWLDEEIPQLMVNAVQELQQKSLDSFEIQSKDPKDILRCYPRLPEDGRIDWSLKAIDILRLINASSEPYGGAYAEFKSKKCIIWRASLYDDNELFLGVPGQIAAFHKDSSSMLVLTGEGKLVIREVEIDGVRTVPTNIFSSVRERLS